MDSPLLIVLLPQLLFFLAGFILLMVYAARA
jgi:hypothetical protein